jgi:hypothetical protein
MTETSKKRIQEILILGHWKLFGTWDLVIGNFQSGDLFLFTPDPGGLSLQASKVEELGPSHLSSADDVDSVHSWRVEGENPLNADPVRDLPYSEGGSNSPLLLANHHSFERLYSFLLSFHDLDMDPYGISHPEVWEICSQLFSFNDFHWIHLLLLPKSVRGEEFTPNEQFDLRVTDLT